jgi:outer membrane autotransporter protein
MGGNWGELAFGGTVNLNKNVSAYGEVSTNFGNPVHTDYQFSAGIRFSFW